MLLKNETTGRGLRAKSIQIDGFSSTKHGRNEHDTNVWSFADWDKAPGENALRPLADDHKVKGVREAIESAGAELRYLPPYSPNLNPVELALSRLKKLLRDGAERTVDKLWQIECRNYFKHCGYRHT